MIYLLLPIWLGCGGQEATPNAPITQTATEQASYPFNNHIEFRSSDKDKRTQHIDKTLQASKISSTNKFISMYIDRMLLEGKAFKSLESSFPTNDYAEFLDKSIVTLFYTYSLDNFSEYIQHKIHPWTGIMWHPEREKKISEFDYKLISKIFNSKHD